MAGNAATMGRQPLRRTAAAVAAVALSATGCGAARQATSARPPTVAARSEHAKARPAPEVPARGAATPTSHRSARRVHRVVYRRAWVGVAVATVWDKRALARPVDALAVSAQPQPARWLSGLTFAQRLDLDNRVATQTLLYDPLLVSGVGGGWAHVVVLGQTGRVFPRGIVGWLPANQITFKPPPAGVATATVSVPAVHTRRYDLSYGTRLPVLSRSGRRMVVATPQGPATVPAADLALKPLPPSGVDVVRQAARFLGLQYMWAGTSAFGFDCSGLTLLVYRQFGVRLARDAADQARQGAVVARADMAPGDLVFYAWGGQVDHVGIYVGGGRMLDAPETGKAIEIVPMWGTPLAAHFAGARRYLPRHS